MKTISTEILLFMYQHTACPVFLPENYVNVIYTKDIIIWSRFHII